MNWWDSTILLSNKHNRSRIAKAGYYNIYYTVCLILAAFTVYYPALFHDFQQRWDDHWVAINYYTEGGLTWDNIWIILTEFYHGQYAPVNELWYTTLYTLYGYDPFWFHAGSLLVHLINVMLCYALIARLLIQSDQFEHPAVIRIAFVTALLFAVHPFLVEAVAWVSASKNIIYTLFYLGALHFYLKYIQTGKFVMYAFTGVFFIISFGGKEQAVTMPVCLLLFDYVLKRNLASRIIWIEKAPFFILALCFGIITVLSQAAADSGVLSDDKFYPFYQRIALAGYTLSEYFIKCVLPVKLSYLYPYPIQVGEDLPLRFYIYPFVAMAGCIGLYYVLRKTWIFFGLALFLIHIAVVLNLVTMARFAIVADRYVYLSSIGVFFLLAYLFNRIIQQKKHSWKLWQVIALLYVCSLAMYAHQRCLVWKNSDTLKKELRELLQQRNDYDNRKPVHNEN